MREESAREAVCAALTTPAGSVSFETHSRRHGEGHAVASGEGGGARHSEGDAVREESAREAECAALTTPAGSVSFLRGAGSGTEGPAASSPPPPPPSERSSAEARAGNAGMGASTCVAENDGAVLREVVGREGAAVGVARVQARGSERGSTRRRATLAPARAGSARGTRRRAAAARPPCSPAAAAARSHRTVTLRGRVGVSVCLRREVGVRFVEGLVEQVSR